MRRVSMRMRRSHTTVRNRVRRWSMLTGLVAMLMGAIIRPSRTGRIDFGSSVDCVEKCREKAWIEGVRIPLIFVSLLPKVTRTAPASAGLAERILEHACLGEGFANQARNIGFELCSVELKLDEDLGDAVEQV